MTSSPPVVPDVGLETSDEECRDWLYAADQDRGQPLEAPNVVRLLRDRSRLLTALSQARDHITAAREELVVTMKRRGLKIADGFGDTLGDLLRELDWQLEELCAREAAARKEERERAAKIARGNIVSGRYITWPCWNPKGNRGIEEDVAKLGEAIATAIEGQP